MLDMQYTKADPKRTDIFGFGLTIYTIRKVLYWLRLGSKADLIIQTEMLVLSLSVPLMPMWVTEGFYKVFLRKRGNAVFLEVEGLCWSPVVVFRIGHQLGHQLENKVWHPLHFGRLPFLLTSLRQRPMGYPSPWINGLSTQTSSGITLVLDRTFLVDWGSEGVMNADSCDSGSSECDVNPLFCFVMTSGRTLFSGGGDKDMPLCDRVVFFGFNISLSTTLLA
jgi:hypothetical protein